MVTKCINVKRRLKLSNNNQIIVKCIPGLPDYSVFHNKPIPSFHSDDDPKKVSHTWRIQNAGNTVDGNIFSFSEPSFQK